MPHNIENLSCEEAYVAGIKAGIKSLPNQDLLIRFNNVVFDNLEKDQKIKLLMWEEIMRRMDAGQTLTLKESKNG